MKALFNGVEPQVRDLLDSRALDYGDGVFRTALVHQGKVHELERHLDKLAADAGRLALIPPPRDLLAAEAQRLASDCPRAVLKIILARRPGGRGYRPTTDECDRLLRLLPAPEAIPHLHRTGIRAFRSPVVLPEQARLAGVKHLNRLEQVLASRDWPPGVEECILCDPAGRPVGGSRSNLFWSSGETLCTPALDHCGVDGITRNKIIALAKQLDVTVQIAPWSWEAFGAATEAFVCNALIGIWPLCGIDGARLPAPGPLTRRLAAALQHPQA